VGYASLLTTRHPFFTLCFRRAYEIQDGWSRGTLPETPQLKAELEALREQELDYRDRYEISRETIQRLMAARPPRLRAIPGERRSCIDGGLLGPETSSEEKAKRED
jgi:hypothetical protein